MVGVDALELAPDDPTGHLIVGRALAASGDASSAVGSLSIYVEAVPVRLDELVDLVIAAPDRPELVARTRSLDRVLLWGHYVIPHWHIRSFRVAAWDKFSRPEKNPPYNLGFDTWWVDGTREKALLEKKGSLKK